MKQALPFAPHAIRFGAIVVLCGAGLAACGGGGGGAAAPQPPALQADFGGNVVGKVARTGVAGTWGYIAPDGGRYAIMGTAKGVLVLDLANPAAPRVVDEIDGPTNTPKPGIYWREMRVYDKYAYIVSEQTNLRGGIMIVDLGGLPASVRFVKSVVPRDGELSAHTIDIDTVRGLMYIQRDNNGPAPVPLASFDKPIAAGSFDDPGKGEHHEGASNVGAIDVYDIKTDPETPRYITTFNRFKSIHDMTAVGDFVYVAEGEASSFSIWNVSDPAAPVLVTRWQVTAGNYAHNIWPSGDRSFVVTTEEIPYGVPAKVWQLNGSAAPTLLASVKSGNGTPHNVVMEGRMAYFSHYTEGAVAVDMTTPSAPRIIARVDTNPSNGNDLTGCWGIYKFPGVPLMACSDINYGFHLITITGS